MIQMGNTSLVIPIIQAVTSIGATVCFIIGLIASVKDIRYINNEHPEEELAHTKAAFKKAMIMIACGIGLYFVSCFFSNLPQMASEFGIAVIALQSLWDAVRKTGPLLLFPYIVKQWRKSARSRAYRE